MIAVRRLVAVLCWALVALLALVMSALYHASLPLTREVARQVTGEFVSGEIGGTLTIGEITELAPHRIVARDAALYDIQGRLVAEGKEAILAIDLEAALRGTLRFSMAHLHGGKVRLIQGESLPTFVELFDDGLPSSGGPKLHAIVDDMRVHDVTVTGELLGLEGIRVEGLSAHGRLEFHDGLEIRIFSASGDMVAPFPFPARIEHLSGRITDNPYESVQLHARATTDGERAHANIRYGVPEGKPVEADGELDLLVHAMPVRAETLSQMGFDWADILHGSAHGYVRLYGPVDDLRLRASLETEGGPATLEGHLPSGADGYVRAHTPAVELEKLVKDSPTVRLSGVATLHLPGDEAAETRATIALEPFRYSGYHVPALQIEGAVLEEGFRIDRARGTYRGGRVTARGYAGYDGSVDLQVRASVSQVARDPNLSRMLPGAQARMEADIRFATRDVREDLIDFRGRIVLHDVAIGTLTASTLIIEGFARGDPDRPEANLAVDGRGLAIAGYPLGTAHLKVLGGPHRYRGSGVFDVPGDRRFELDASLDATRDQYVLNAERLELSLGKLVWRGAAEQVVIRPGEVVTVERFLLANDDQRLEAHGTWRFQGPDEIHAELQSFDLAGLGALLGDMAPPITGVADAHLVIEGEIENPEIVLEGALRGTSYRGVDDVDLAYVFTYRDGQLALDAQADLHERGSVTITSGGVIDPTVPDLLEALEGGIYEVEVALADLALPVVRALVGEDVLPPVQGVIGGRGRVSGPIQVPSFEGGLVIPALGLAGWPELEVRSQLSYNGGALSARLMTADEHGELFEAEGSVVLDLVHLAQHPELAAAVLEVAPWRIAVRLPPRTAGSWPERLRASVPEELHPLRIAGSATLAGGSLRTQGDLVAHVDWSDPLAQRPCGNQANPRMTLTARLEDGVTRASVVGHVGTEQVLRARAEAPTPIDEWLEAGGRPPIPPLSITATLRQLDLAETPWLCESLEGNLSGWVEVAGLFTERPEAKVGLASSRLVLRRFRQDSVRSGTTAVAHAAPPMRGSLAATVDTKGLEGNAALRWRNGGTANVHVRLPMTWNASHPVPELQESDPLALDAAVSQMPLALLLAPVPNLVQVDGTVDGRIVTTGSLLSPDIKGQVRIHDGQFNVMPTGQQLSGVEGELVFHGDWVELSRLVAREQDGSLQIRGAIHLDGIAPSRGRIELEADAFPVRSDGAVLAILSGRALIEAEIESDQSVARVVLRELSLALPEDGLRSVQPLEPHPDVQIVGVEGLDRSRSSPYPIVITLRSAQPFWVRRNDFAALVTMDLGVTYMEPDVLVDGDVTIRRGFFEVFGKRFEVEEARMRFDGGKQMNPYVTLRATHRLRMGGAADTVSVSVTGRMESPEVQFTTTVPECQDRGDIIALLMTGRCARTSRQSGDEMQASQQAASFLAGVAAGVLTLSAREQFGDIIPVIVVESGEHAFRSARVRAGFKADAIIPKPFRPYVLGAYVEGFFSTAGTETVSANTVQGRDNGFLLELQFPANIVGTGAFAPPNNWSLDLTWEP
jgi:autotransporter translocation and assembly factor TamB